MPAVATFALLATLATAGLSFAARPWGNRALRGTMYEMLRTRASAGVRPQVFTDDFPGLIIYTDHVDTAADRLEHVLIADERDPQQRNTIFAREANRSGPKLATPLAGDDPEAVQVAAGLVRDAGFEPVVVGKLADARRFQRGAPGYGQAVTAAELKQKLSLAP